MERSGVARAARTRLKGLYYCRPFLSNEEAFRTLTQ
jgi:hypothetical protein